MLRTRIQPALDRQTHSVPKEVLISSIPNAQSLQNVMHYPKSGLMTEEELAITQKTATELVRLLSTGQLTSEACTRAFIKSAGIATQLVNCCTEILGEEAIARAKELDAHLQKTGETIGPLHGLPMSIKEHTIMKGKVVHSSYVALINNIEPQNGLLVDVLEECGAVPFCRTTQPQSVM